MITPTKTVFLQVACLLYKIVSDIPIQIPEEFSQFVSNYEALHSSNLQTIHCEVIHTNKYSEIQGDLKYQDHRCMVFESNGRETRIHGMNNVVNGITYETDDFSIRIELPTADETIIDLDFLEMLFMERFLLKNNALILHSSFIKIDKKGLVFTAPSGTGKSTQAELWKKYANAKIINGDRSILLWNDKTKTCEVYGLPFCGSSMINKNEHAPLSAIVYLKQAKINTAELLPIPKAAGYLFSEISINRWNKNAVLHSLDIIDQIAKSVPCISYSCNMEPNAVSILHDYLKW